MSKTTGIKPFIINLKRLDSGLRQVRQAAAQSLGQSGDPRAVEPLIHALGDRDNNVRQAAAQALRQLGNARTVDPLIRALENWSMDVRQEAAQVLGQLGDTRAVGPLIHILGDGSKSERQIVAQALGQLGEGTFADAILAALNGKPQALAKLKDPRALEPLIRALDYERVSIRRAASQALGDRDVREAAAQALGQLGDPHAVEPLIHTLRDNDWRVCQTAAQALGQLGDTRALKPLIRALGDDGWWVRQAAAQALGKLGDLRAIEPLIRTLGDGNDDVRQTATQAIRAICQNNQRRLGSNCVCIEHLNRFSLQQVSLSAFEKAGYYACRTCQADQPRYETVSDVVLVLDDRAIDSSPVQQENVLYIPWSLARGIFDFDIVEIRTAASSNIERFLVQFEEDTDPARPWKQENTGKLPCRVSPGCTLSPADRARLQRHFEIMDEAVEPVSHNG